jgi:hypothetical protein
MNLKNTCVSLQTMQSIIATVLEQNPDDMMELNMSPESLNRLISKRAWARSWLAEIPTMLTDIIFFGLDRVGAEDMHVPAEYTAAVIFMTCHPCNYQTACQLMARAQFTNKMAAAIRGSEEVLTKSQLFALVVSIHDADPENPTRKQFARKVQLLSGVVDDEVDLRKEARNAKKKAEV